MGKNDPARPYLIGIVGPCGSGKTTLKNNLQARGYSARAIAQEHSFVPSMWEKITHPDYLVFLDASYPITILRKQLNWNVAEYQEQHRRLYHARMKADLYVQTDDLSPNEVMDIVIAQLQVIYG